MLGHLELGAILLSRGLVGDFWTLILLTINTHDGGERPFIVEMITAALLVAYWQVALMVSEGQRASVIYPIRPYLPIANAPRREASSLSTPTMTSEKLSKRQLTVVISMHYKTLANMLGAVQAAISPASKLLAATTAYAALVCGGAEVLRILAPLTSAIKMAGTVIRQRKGHVVTVSMQREAVAQITWQLDLCRKILETVAKEKIWPGITTTTDLTSTGKTPTRDSSSTANITSSPRSSVCRRGRKGLSGRPARSGALPIEKKPVSPYMCREKKHQPANAGVSPGAAFVPLRRATQRVDPRASLLRRSGAVCR